MTQVNLNNEEAHIIAILRAIKAVDSPLVSVQDIGVVAELLSGVVDLDADTKDLTQKEVKQLLRGFVLAVVAVRAEDLASQSFYPTAVAIDEDDDWDDADTPVGGGPSNTVVAGQGEDPRYIHQTGPRDDQE